MTATDTTRESDAHQIRKMLVHLNSGGPHRNVLQLSEGDREILSRALKTELERVATHYDSEGYTFERVDGDDPRWKGWGVRGSAKDQAGWIVTKDGEEVHRFVPESTITIPFRMVKKMFADVLKLKEIEARKKGKRQ